MCGRRARTTSGPIVMFGTKWPSMTSTWIQSAPAATTSRTSSPSRAKSADRIEGAMTIGLRSGSGLSDLPVPGEDAACEDVGCVEGHQVLDREIVAGCVEKPARLAQARAVERVADRARVGEVRLLPARARCSRCNAAPRARARSGSSASAQHQLRDREAAPSACSRGSRCDARCARTSRDCCGRTVSMRSW